MGAIAASLSAATWRRHSGNAAARGRSAELILTPRFAAPLARHQGAAWITLGAIALVLAGGQRTAGAEVKFEVGGAVEAADETLDVRVDVTNGGDVAAAALDVRGELGDEEDLVAMPNGVPAGATRSVLFRFARVPDPGIHVLALRLDYMEAPAHGRTATTTS